MNNEANRLLIVLFAAGVIVLMAVVIFLTWSADADVIDRIGDLSEYLDAHNDDAGKLIVTLAALVVVVLALLLIIVELAPEDEERELRVKQAGAVTIVPASALRRRLEEALLSRPNISAARARVSSGDKGIVTGLNLTVRPGSNVANVSQDAVRVAVDAIQNELGLPVDGVPTVRVVFAEGAAGQADGSPPAVPSTASSRPDFPRTPAEPYQASASDAGARSTLPDEPLAPEVSGPPMPVDEPAPGPASETREAPANEEQPRRDDQTEDAAERRPPDPEISRDPWRQP
jgi:hypothetical protein